MEITSKLDKLDREILAKVPTSGALEPQCYATWIDGRGEVCMGPVRLRRVIYGITYWDCSPFPGAWDHYITEGQFLVVRALGAMGLDIMSKEELAWIAISKYGVKVSVDDIQGSHFRGFTIDGSPAMDWIEGKGSKN
jgi:hypothetical protein